jgi:8-oxo-dGTP pyrophosphatase MutT (NUDIX family)
MIERLTLCLVYDTKRISLGLIKRGFGVGKYNGYRGEPENGEALIVAADRETFEEANARAINLKPRGKLDLRYLHNGKAMEVHLFSASGFDREPKETEEMKPKWFEISQIPFEMMLVDDRFWLPHILAGRNIKGDFTFHDDDRIKGYLIEIEKS